MQAALGYSYARPAIDGNLVYFGTGDGQVEAREQTDGRLRWRASVGGRMVSGANLVVRSGVVVAPVVIDVFGLDAATGQQLWHYQPPPDTTRNTNDPPLPGEVTKSRIDADSQTVYIPAWGASVSALDLRTGAVRWVWQPGPSASDTAISGIFRSGAGGVRVSGDTVFATVWHFLQAAGSASEVWLVALDRATGRELWRVVRGGVAGTATQGAPVLYQNLVIFAASSGHVYAVDRASQQIVWEFPSHGRETTLIEPALSGDTLYVDGGDQQLYALHAGEGSTIWAAPYGVDATTDMLVTPRRIIVASGMYLYVLDRATGQVVKRLEEPRVADGLFSSPAAASGQQIFVSVNYGEWSFDEP